MSQKQLRWGILGAANIAQKNWDGLRNSGNNRVIAVASRNRERARKFIDSCQISAPAPAAEAMDSYEALLSRSDIDAVYIPLPTGLRKEWVIKAAQAGKHVLCEKPCGCTLKDLQEMIAICEKHKVQFMDGVMFMHSRRLEAVREHLLPGKHIGSLRRITSAFSFNGGSDFEAANIRMSSDLEPHGCLGDLGWYSIRFSLWAMNWQLPASVSGRILSQASCPGSPAAVPVEFSGELIFEGGVSASFYCSFITENQQWCHVSGSQGSLRIDDFVLPFFGSRVCFETEKPHFRMERCVFNMESHSQRHSIDEYSNNHPTSQETNLFRNFAQQVMSGSLSRDWPEQALKTQRVVESCLASARAGGKSIPA